MMADPLERATEDDAFAGEQFTKERAGRGRERLRVDSRPIFFLDFLVPVFVVPTDFSNLFLLLYSSFLWLFSILVQRHAFTVSSGSYSSSSFFFFLNLLLVCSSKFSLFFWYLF